MKITRTLVALTACAAAASALTVLPAAAQEPSASPSASAATSSPTPAPSPCIKPTARVETSWSLAPERVAAGDEVAVQASVGGTYDLCQERRETHTFRLRAREQGQAEFTEVDRRTIETVNGFGYRYDARPAATTQFELFIDDQRVAPTGSDTVVVDRVSGSCANALTLSAPPNVPVGTQVLLVGNSSDTSTVRIAFRKRGQTSFSVRRTLQPASEQREFRTSFTADDDYRLYAFNARCDSPAVLVTAAPTVTGPATVRKGSTVTLTVRAAAGMPLAVAFRRAGQTTFTVRRTGTAGSNGVYTTTYTADADYRYYAYDRPGQRSNTGLTQAR